MAKKETAQVSEQESPKESSKQNDSAKASTSEVTEQEISDIEAWELRYQQLQSENHILQERLYDLREQLLVAQRELLRRDKEKAASTRNELLTRLKVDSDSLLVERDGKYVIQKVNGTKSDA